MATVLPNERFLTRVLDSITDPLVIYDRDYRILIANRALAALHRRDPGQLIGKHCYEVFYGRRAVCEDCHIADVLRTGEPQRREKSIRLPGGQLRHFEIHAYPVRDADGTITQAIEHARDISERKTLENRVMASEEKYQAIVEIAREGIFIADGEARVTFANKRLAGMLGYSLEDLMGRSLFDLMDERSTAVAKEQLDRRRKGLADVYELSFRSRDGMSLVALVSAAPLMVHDSFLGSVGIVTDITRMKQVESELRSAKEFSEKIINNITDNLIVVDPVTHRIVQANASFLDRVGLDPGNVLEKPCYAVMLGRKTPCWEEGVRCPVREAAATKRPAQCDKVYPNAEGQERMLQVSTYPLFDSRGDVELVIRLERDVTEKRRMEEALAFRSKELQRTQHQLETLFEISRRVGAEESLAGLIHFLHDFSAGVFPDSDPLFLILDADGDRFLSFEECRPDAIEPLRRLQHKMEEARLVADLARQLRMIKDPQAVTSADDCDRHSLLKSIADVYPSWFGLPILVRQQCIGYFLLGSNALTNYSREDLRFFQALFAQIGGHIRNLVLHESEISRLRRAPAEKTSHGGIIGQSRKMLAIYDLIDLVAMSDATVLITGENGTGKELVARAIHQRNFRRTGPFVVANCSAYSPSLLESELFGHEKGAFTGAVRQKKGRIERAQGGTLFLDEIGDLSLATQVLLLRFLQDRRFERVGGEETIEANVRILAATNRDLHREVEDGRFREDLYYRLNVFSINMPPLRERKEDIPLLARHLLDRFGLKEGKRIREISADAMQALMDYHWPGNVRQLENAISYAVILCPGEEIKIKHLPPFLKESAGGSADVPLAENERRAILRALEESGWNKHEAARRLQVSRSTLYSKIRRHGLERGAGIG
ncbi:MAG: sigma-54-dependent Fis family transcriptional regulator [Deltaproteobacteria bacterium]|nr:sigma-54-dependent Fis family transcriptional regulator [Deltaproteobacteria bacterium]